MTHSPPCRSRRTRRRKPATSAIARYPDLNDLASVPGPAGPSDLAARRVGRWAGVMVVTIMLGLGGLLVRVVQLQSRPDRPVAALVNSQHSSLTLNGRRGSLFDRRGRVLATSRIAHHLFVDPLLIVDPNTFSETLGYALGYDPAWIERRISRRPGSRWVSIDRRISDVRIKSIKDEKLSGAAVSTWLARDYPKQQRAGQVIGVVGRDGHGLEGIESAYERVLRGVDGSLDTVRDAGRRTLWVSAPGYVAPVNGHSIMLTIDLTIQAIAEEALQAACSKFAAPSGQIVVLSAGRGDILAMANFPFFDPNHLDRSRPQIRRNRCVTDMFEPGSIFKPFVWAAAVDADVVGIDQIIDCTKSGFYVSPRGRRLRDTRGHGRLTWEQVLIKSSNIGMAIVGQKLGTGRMHDALRRFGFGQKTQCGLPGESVGKVNPRARWNHYSVTSVPMGHEVAATPIQLVRAFAALANDGLMAQPRIIFPQSHEATAPIYERVVSSRTAGLTRRALRRAVTSGTGRRADSPLYEIFGKTGTAQIAAPDGRGYLEDQYVASFICGAPYEGPRIVVGCFIHRPDTSIAYYGGTVAAPVARRVVEQTLSYLGVPPKTSDRLDSYDLARR